MGEGLQKDQNSKNFHVIRRRGRKKGWKEQVKTNPATSGEKLAALRKTETTNLEKKERGTGTSEGGMGPAGPSSVKRGQTKKKGVKNKRETKFRD